VDLHLLAEAGLLDELVAPSDNGVTKISNFHPRIVFCQPSLNDFMACDKKVWVAVRNRLISLFMAAGDEDDVIEPNPSLQNNLPLQSNSMHLLENTLYHLPATIGDYTDFYSSREHATNVGIMFRGKDNALQPNWLHMPIGYHGRSSSIFPSLSTSRGSSVGSGKMSTIRRPCGQLQIDASDPTKGSTYGPCKLMDFELEVAFFVGGPTNRDEPPTADNKEPIGKPLTLDEAANRIFGYVLMNDWSARDIQKWEYVPLGPFTAKNFATTISTWVVTSMALDPFRCETSAGKQGGDDLKMNDDAEELNVGKGDPTPLDYLKDPNYGSYDVNLTVSLQPSNTQKTTKVCQSNLKHMYWSSVQQLVHHSVTGCPMRAGDLLASGTISGKEQHNFGSMLELSWKGNREIILDGAEGSKEVRKFLKDGDAVIMEGWCRKEGIGRVGFGQCSARILPAIPFPYEVEEKIVQAATATQPTPKFTNFKLYGFWRSSCTWRVRIALAAKEIPYEIVPIYLFSKEQMIDDYTAKNHMQQVPTLEFNDETDTIVRITQSLAIIEFLDSAFADRGGMILPLEPIARAKAKEIAEIVNSGIQPLQNLSTIQTLDSMAAQQGNPDEGVGKKFAKEAIEKGLSILEDKISRLHAADRKAGPFAVGSFGPTIADICLVPQFYNGRRFGIEVERICPTIVQIENACKNHPWFRAVLPDMQRSIDSKK